MGANTVIETRPALPRQKDGRTELQELAAVLAQQVDQRHRDRGAYPAEPDVEPGHYDLSVEPEPLPVREPESLSTTLSKGVRRAVPLVFAAALTAVICAAAWTTTHATPAHQLTPARAAGPAQGTQASQATQTPTTPTQWGAAAHQRLSRAGHPVDVFGCQGAYAADGALAPQVLPPASTSPDSWSAYLAACLSDMSGASSGHSG